MFTLVSFQGRSVPDDKICSTALDNSIGSHGRQGNGCEQGLKEAQITWKTWKFLKLNEISSNFFSLLNMAKITHFSFSKFLNFLQKKKKFAQISFIFKYLETM